MDANRNYGTGEESFVGDTYHERDNENENERLITKKVDSSDTSNIAQHIENKQAQTCLRKLYMSIVKGEKDRYSDIVSEIVGTGTVDLNKATFEGEYVADIHKTLTTLQLVCGKGDEYMLLELFKLNVDVNNTGKCGKTPLNIACLHGHLDLVKLLVARGADLDTSNVQEDGDTALITTVACYQPELENAEKYLGIGKLLLESGACPNKGDKYGVSPIYSAVMKSDDRYTKLLLRYGANPDAGSTKYASPLCKALDSECYHNAHVLLTHGCEVNRENNGTKPSCGPTPLHLAVTKNNLAMILTLLNAGADPNCYIKHADESVYLHSSVLHFAASEGQLLTLWLLLVKGGKINSQHDFRRDTPLLILARKGSLEGVKMLLRFGADVELESQVGTTPVWAAVRENHLKVLQILLETCCSLEIPSMEYHMYMPLTPLEVALRLQSWNMALKLLNAGANHKISTLKHVIPAPVSSGGQRIIRTRAAYRLPPEDYQALKELRIWKSKPKTLTHTCRATLRSHFTVQLPNILKMLNYPIRLQNYLYMKQ